MKHKMVSIGDDNEVTLETRDFCPAHLLFKIESFSLLSENSIDKIESSEFESDNKYKWKLIIYPEGRRAEDGANHVSAYLVVENKSKQDAGWELNAFVSIFLFNRKLDTYVFKKGQRRFHLLNPEWGFSKFIMKETLTNPSNGYLVDDSCVFGAEVFVVKNEGIRECMSILKVTNSFKHELKISKFSELEKEWNSQEFNVGDHKWKVCVYPKGNGAQKGSHVSIFLHKVGFSSGEKVKADCSICIKNQSGIGNHKYQFNRLFSASSSSWGWSSFIPIADMKQPGFLVGDLCIIEVEISIQAVLRNLPHPGNSNPIVTDIFVGESRDPDTWMFNMENVDRFSIVCEKRYVLEGHGYSDSSTTTDDGKRLYFCYMQSRPISVKKKLCGLTVYKDTTSGSVEDMMKGAYYLVFATFHEYAMEVALNVRMWFRSV
ncbi:unnamed protein product [Fraxinus pennsylvanica]|uniref:MATH domain-containing protein n=1 Tax=Fraxinus pennsylvanica TaxID=56036 RepID=A0AAD2E688_9LAMI|nr:unnamed protein product [Fraxinus pennsylvanica]